MTCGLDRAIAISHNFPPFLAMRRDLHDLDWCPYDLPAATHPAETKMTTIPIALSGWMGVCKNTS